uniref:Reverse transcriptase domain-containing protein n=1 Tax=Haemonchus contortus TaxID=6289 RepID=A0A7I4XWT2_HAECO
MGKPQTSRTKIEEIAVSFYTILFRSTAPICHIPTPIQEVTSRIEEWESASYTIIKQLTKRFNECLDAQRILDQWKKSNTVVPFKKGKRDQLKNYRPIALLSQPYKLFTEIVLNRLERQLYDYQPVEQAGLRKDFCCMDHIHTITL